ncbi:hypothetical protein F442_22194 [Phytophthora nicotianae P10297]|uniref:Uncharacterized protein n=1 Tax=Phytophthora nicotianae P10297 TaxID=1317064 RepID=W2Y195_PHYNI|nr:hypothetical protein F442_22194 [Phytophthora nicotianae P10297]
MGRKVTDSVCTNASHTNTAKLPICCLAVVRKSAARFFKNDTLLFLNCAALFQM